MAASQSRCDVLETAERSPLRMAPRTTHPVDLAPRRARCGSKFRPKEPLGRRFDDGDQDAFAQAATAVAAGSFQPAKERGRTRLNVADRHDDHLGSLDVSIGLGGTFGRRRDIDAPDSEFGCKLVFQFARKMQIGRHRSAD